MTDGTSFDNRQRPMIPPGVGGCQFFIMFSRRLLSTTLMLENAISALAHIGVICHCAPKM